MNKKETEKKKVTAKKVEKKRQNNFFDDAKKYLKKYKKLATVLYAAALLFWVYAVLIASQYILSFIFLAIVRVGWMSESQLSSPLVNLIFSALVYMICLVITVFVPWFAVKQKTTRDELGLRGLPTWQDILLSPIAYLVSTFVAMLFILLFESILPSIDWNQSQQTGFTNLIGVSQMLQGFIALVIIAPIAEEIVFRGWLYGKLRVRMSAIPAMILVSLLFGFAHGQWNVGVTVFVMSIVLCVIRELTGTIWSGILVHIIRNGLAFYLLYVLGVA